MPMIIKSYNHKGLKALAASTTATSVKGVQKDLVSKLRRQLTAIQSAADIHQLLTMQMWKLHELKPKYPGKWSMTVTGNWRLTFRLDPDTNVVSDVDLEDYH